MDAIKKTKSKCLLSMLLMLCMVASFLTMTAHAAYPDTVVFGNNNILSSSMPFLVNGVPAATGTLGYGGCTAHYDVSTGVLTLNNYSGEDIRIGNGNTTADATVMLIGSNTITENGSGEQRGLSFNPKGTLTITSESGGSLTVNVTSSDNNARAIMAFENGKIVVGGDAKLTLNASTGTQKYQNAYGIYCGANGSNVEIKDSASVSVTASSDGEYTRCYGIFTREGLEINTEGDVILNVYDVDETSDNTCIYVFGSGNVTVDNVNSLGCSYNEYKGKAFSEGKEPTMTGFIKYTSYYGYIHDVWKKPTVNVADQVGVVGNMITVLWEDGAEKFDLCEPDGTVVCGNRRSNSPGGMYILPENSPTTKTYYFSVYFPEAEQWIRSNEFTVTWKTGITSVDITNVPTPAAGEPCAISVADISESTDPLHAAHINDIYWFDETNDCRTSSTDTFILGNSYYLCILYEAEDGYAFMFEQTYGGTNPYLGTATIDGEEALAYQILWSDTKLALNGKSVLPKNYAPITSVSVPNVPTPVAGRLCATDDISVITTPANAADAVLKWWDGTAGRYTSSTDTFIEEHEYSIIIELEPKSGYEFEFDSDSPSTQKPYTGTATINGEAAGEAAQLSGSVKGLSISGYNVEALAEIISPQIISQPQNVILEDCRKPAQFYVEFVSPDPITYEWQLYTSNQWYKVKDLVRIGLISATSYNSPLLEIDTKNCSGVLTNEQLRCKMTTNGETFYSETAKFTVHHYNIYYSLNETRHEIACIRCSASGSEDHLKKWICDIVATPTQNGKKHFECVKCGYFSAQEDYSIGTVPTAARVKLYANRYKNDTEIFDEYYAAENTYRLPSYANILNAGYIFKGWALTPDAIKPVWKPDERMLVPAGTTNLYAVWEKAYISLANETVTIKSDAVYNNITVIVSTYKDGKLIKTICKTVNLVDGTNDVSFYDFDTTGADTVKVMAWENFSSIKPLFDVYTKKL